MPCFSNQINYMKTNKTIIKDIYLSTGGQKYIQYSNAIKKECYRYKKMFFTNIFHNNNITLE